VTVRGLIGRGATGHSRCSWRPLDGDVSGVGRSAQTLAPEEVDRWATEHRFFDALDEPRKNLDEIAKTDFRRG
jgi:hypothetical protein